MESNKEEEKGILSNTIQEVMQLLYSLIWLWCAAAIPSGRKSPPAAVWMKEFELCFAYGKLKGMLEPAEGWILNFALKLTTVLEKSKW